MTKEDIVFLLQCAALHECTDTMEDMWIIENESVEESKARDSRVLRHETRLGALNDAIALIYAAGDKLVMNEGVPVVMQLWHKACDCRG